MLGMGIQELLILIVIIGALHFTGLWPIIARGLEELRGGPAPGAGGGRGASGGGTYAPHGAADVDWCYRLLGISSGASWEEIERAYRRKAKVHHPDHGGDEDAMRALNEAYATLKSRRTHA